MSCDRDMCFHNIWNDIPCEECPCYKEQKEGAKMPDKKKNRFGADPFFFSLSSKKDTEEAAEEARREAMKLDDNEDTLKWKGSC